MNTIKITSGKYRGRSIRSPESAATHPMGAREKLALFNTIASYLPGATVLDAYAGSGALGIEALSRGAAHVVFVEKSPKAAHTIRDNLTALGLSENASVREWDAKVFLPAGEFDITLVDPPYDKYETRGAENLAKFVKHTGILVLSHPGEAPEIPGLTLTKTSKYAAAHLSFYKHKSIDEQLSTTI